MTDREAIDVLFNEWKCIDRNDGIHCDRKCESCDLVMDVGIIREAFNMAISALEEQELKQELKQEVKNSKKSSLTQNALDTINRQAAISELMEWVEKEEKKSWSTFKGLFHWTGIKAMLECLPSAQPEWNNHTVACLLAELFDDTCACNYFGIDEWLPSKCELLDSCPNPVGVACWEQFLKHRAERRTSSE